MLNHKTIYMKEKLRTAISNEYSNLGLAAKVIDGAVSFLEPTVTADYTEEQFTAAVKSVGGLLKSFQSESDVIRQAKSLAEKRALELEEKLKGVQNPTIVSPKPEDTNKGLTKEDIEAIIAARLGDVTTVKSELDAIKAKEAADRRSSFIVNEAKRLGIPQSRIDEGFAFDNDADETSITSKLGIVANNVKAMSAPIVKTSVPITATGHTLTDEKRAELDRKYKRF